MPKTVQTTDTKTAEYIQTDLFGAFQPIVSSPHNPDKNLDTKIEQKAEGRRQKIQKVQNFEAESAEYQNQQDQNSQSQNPQTQESKTDKPQIVEGSTLSGTAETSTLEAKPKKSKKVKDMKLKSLSNSPFAELLALKALEAKEYIGNIINQRKVDKIEDLLSLRDHTSIAVRRKLATDFHRLGDKSHLQVLKGWKERESDGETILGLESTIDKISREVDGLDKSEKVYTVSEAMILAKKLLGDRQYIIEGELMEVKVFPTMYYFALKDTADSRINCAIFAGSVKHLNFPLNEGLTVRTTGKFTLDKNSRLTFYITKIELTGEGILRQNLEKLKNQLEGEGLFDPDRKRKIKAIPKNVLLICSPNSAAIDDFLKVISHRRTGLNIYHLPIKTQGVGAENNILNALEMANEICDEHPIDTIVLTRGGGSSDDLMVFNSEKIARSLYALNAPTIVAIGHEKDWTISEMVADKRASTPSNAAELCSLSNSEILGSSFGYLDFVSNYTSQKVQDYRLSKLKLSVLIARRLMERINQIKEFAQKIRIIEQKIIQNIQSLLSTHKLIQKDIWQRIISYKATTKEFWQRIRQAVKWQLESTKNDLNMSYTQLMLSSPHEILKKGYAIIWQNQQNSDSVQASDLDKSGSKTKEIVIEKMSDLKSGQNLRIEFWDGSVEIKPQKN